jgi:hypothetical protein
LLIKWFSQRGATSGLQTGLSLRVGVAAKEVDMISQNQPFPDTLLSYGPASDPNEEIDPTTSGLAMAEDQDLFSLCMKSDTSRNHLSTNDSPNPEMLMMKLESCLHFRREAVQQKAVRSKGRRHSDNESERLSALANLVKYYKGKLSKGQLRSHGLGLMIYWWLQNKDCFDVKSVFEFDCRGKLVFYMDQNGNLHARIEVDEVKTSESQVIVAKEQCTKRLVLLCGAVMSVCKIPLKKISLTGKVLVARALRSGCKPKELIRKGDKSINLEILGSNLSVNV